MKRTQMNPKGQFSAESALHWYEPGEVLPEMIGAAIHHGGPANYFELVDLFAEYNIFFDGTIACNCNSREEVVSAIKFSDWDSFQDDSEVIQLQSYIEEIIGKF